jgi:hypothetical protein
MVIVSLHLFEMPFVTVLIQ